MTKKHSYMDESEKNPDPAPVEKENVDKTQMKKEEGDGRTDPGLKKGYNEKNPTQPQGSFTADSQADKPSEKNQGDESADA